MDSISVSRVWRLISRAARRMFLPVARTPLISEHLQKRRVGLLLHREIDLRGQEWLRRGLVAVGIERVYLEDDGAGVALGIGLEN